MADGAKYVASSFTLTAKIGEVEFNDIIACSATFGLNSIPSATLIVASGRDYIRNKNATIHDNRDKLRHRDKAVVTLTIKNASGQLDMMEEGTYIIFDGYLAGIGYQRAYDSCSYTLHLLHWLDDLNNSSMVNGNWFPGAPYDLAQNAAYYALSTPGPVGGGGGGLMSTVPSIDPDLQIINLANVQTDLWGSVFQPIFRGVAEWPLPLYQAEDGEKNDAALKALDRMPPAGNAKGAEFYTPLALNLDNIDGTNVPFAIQQAINHDAMASFAYTTFWSKLVGEYAPQFFFAISPGVEHALAIPFFAGLNKEWAVIDSNDYGYSSFNANMSQIIESVNIFYPAASTAGFGNGGTTEAGASFRLPLGSYPEEPPPENKRGMKLLKEPPGWLTNFTPFASLAGYTTGVTNQKPIGDTSKSQTGASNTPAGTKQSEPALAEIQRSEAMNRFAEHWYKTEVLYQRHGELSGKLRFDIAPGSIVKIHAPPFDLDKPNEFDKFFATVTQVSYVINAEKANAGTSFVLAHVRTEKENEDTQLLTAPIPPLYMSEWKGGRLAIKS